MTAGVRHERAEPVFFLSYAHARTVTPGAEDPDESVYRFYLDLAAMVSELLPLSADRRNFFIDREIRGGERWESRLTKELSSCSVFVPLYSRRYFQQDYCGREWSVITQRLRQTRATPTGRRPQVIVPVMWEPVDAQDLPATARDIEYTHPDLGAEYHERGLWYLIKTRQREAYRAVVRALARRIAEIALGSEQLPPLRTIPNYRELPNAFTETEAQQATVPVAVYLTQAADFPAVRTAIESYLQAAGLEIAEEIEPVIGSLWWTARARKRAVGVGQDAALLLDATAWGPVRSRQADNNLTNSQAAKNIADTLSTCEAGVIQIGSLLGVKRGGVVTIVTLSLAQVSELERRPILLKDPETVLEHLQRVTDPEAPLGPRPTLGGRSTPRTSADFGP